MLHHPTQLWGPLLCHAMEQRDRMNSQPAHSPPKIADARRCHSTGDSQGVTTHRARRAACWHAFSAGTQHGNGIKNLTNTNMPL